MRTKVDASADKRKDAAQQAAAAREGHRLQNVRRHDWAAASLHAKARASEAQQQNGAARGVAERRLIARKGRDSAVIGEGQKDFAPLPEEEASSGRLFVDERAIFRLRDGGEGRHFGLVRGLADRFLLGGFLQGLLLEVLASESLGGADFEGALPKLHGELRGWMAARTGKLPRVGRRAWEIGLWR